MITRHNVGGGRYSAHDVSGNIIRLSDVPRGHRPTPAETALDAALRVRMMHLGEHSVIPDAETYRPRVCS
jgi:hypothetical protein